MKRIPPEMVIVSFERPSPAFKSTQWPNCEDCTAMAEFAILARLPYEPGGEYFNFCSRHLEERLATEPGFAVRVIAGIVREKIEKIK